MHATATGLIPASDEAEGAADALNATEVRIETRFLPADWRDGLAGIAGCVVWWVVTVGLLTFAIFGLAELLDLDPKVEFETRELARFVRDALQELTGLVFLLLLAYCAWRWCRGAATVDIGPAGVRLNRRLGGAVQLAWHDIEDVRRPGWWIQLLTACSPAFPTRFASVTLGGLRNYRIVSQGRPIYLSLASPAAFEQALTRWRRDPAPRARPSRWRRAARVFMRVLSPALAALCFALAFVMIAAPIKYMAEWAATGSNYQTRVLLRAFLLKPSARAPAARQPMLVAAARIADPYVARRVLERMGSLRELELDPPLVELAVRGAGGLARDPYGVQRLSGYEPEPAQARESERIDVVRQLVAHHARIEPGALLVAALRGQLQLFAALVSLGAPVEDFDDRGIPDVATVAGAPGNGLTLYLKSKADPQQADEQGNTPLAYAALGGRETNIDLLLSHGASLETANRGRETPLLYVLRSARTAQAHAGARYLIAKGADRTARSSDGSSAAHFAVRSSPVDLLELVVQASGGYRVTNDAGHTLLHAAAQYGAAPDMLRHLMGQGVSVRAADRSGATPLHVARSAGVAEALLEGGADLNARNSSGHTPLHAAVRQNNFEVAKALIARGARKDAPDEAGKIAADYIPRASTRVRQFTELLKP